MAKKEPIKSADELKTFRLSPSSINTFRQCPRRWYYQYIQQLPDKPSIALKQGSIIHLVLENLYDITFDDSLPLDDNRKILYDKAISLLNEFWAKEFDGVIEIPDSEKEQGMAESIELLDFYVMRIYMTIKAGIAGKRYKTFSQGFKDISPDWKEMWLTDEFQLDCYGNTVLRDKSKGYMDDSNKIPMENALYVRGKIDAVQRDRFKGTCIIDYKTSKKEGHVLDDNYILQLGIYAYMWYRQYQKFPDYICVDYLRYGEVFYIPVTFDLIKKAVNEIKSVRNSLIEFGITKDNFYKYKNKLCNWCPYKDKCIDQDD